MTKVKCPTCKQLVTWSPDNPFRPFCSQQCQLLDFGNWANGQYKLPSEEDGPDNDFHTQTD